jgi:GST-like protein
MTADLVSFPAPTPVTLYGAKTGNCLRVSIALEEAFIPYSVVNLNLDAGEHRLAKYVELNPLAKVPTLIDAFGPGGRHVISQSNSIMLYVAEKAPGRLMPFARGPQRSRAHERLFFFITDVIAPSHAAFHLTQASDGQNAKALEARALSALCFAERFASESKFIAGDEFSLADIAGFTIAAAMEPLLPWEVLPNFKRWFDCIARRESVVRGLKAFDRFQTSLR